MEVGIITNIINIVVGYIYIYIFSKYCDVFISVAERCENIMLTLVKRSTERYYALFTARFCNVPIT